MRSPRELRWPEVAAIVPGSPRVVVPLTDPEITRRALEAAAIMTRDIGTRILLIAVWVLPFPADLECPVAIRRHLEARMTELAQEYPNDIEALLVLARDTETGYRQALDRGSAVLVATRKRWWPTREKKLARMLAREGFEVTLVEV